MNPPTNGVHEFPSEAREAAPPTLQATRPMYWAIRRELWENRSVYIAPLVVTLVVLFGSLISTMFLPSKIRNLPADPAQQKLVTPFKMAPAPIMLASFLVGFFYSLEALYGERRDRSILFWKSLPVSDATTVLSKASIPLVVLPLLAFLLSIATVTILMFVGTAVLMANGMSPARLWTGGMAPEPLIMFYGLAVHTLWFAPIYAWLMLVSAWARRTPVLWALLPPFAIAALERMAFGTSYFGYMLQYRVTGAMKEAFTRKDGHITRFAELDPIGFLSTPGLWVGLIVAALCLAAAVRLRRNREPI